MGSGSETTTTTTTTRDSLKAKGCRRVIHNNAVTRETEPQIPRSVVCLYIYALFSDLATAFYLHTRHRRHSERLR